MPSTVQQYQQLLHTPTNSADERSRRRTPSNPPSFASPRLAKQFTPGASTHYSPLPSPSLSIPHCDQNWMMLQAFSSMQPQQQQPYSLSYRCPSDPLESQFPNQCTAWDTRMSDPLLCGNATQQKSAEESALLTPQSEATGIEEPQCFFRDEAEAGAGNAIQQACYHGHDTIVKLLLDRGADANAPNASGQMPLHIGAKQGHRGVVKLLLQSRADVFVKDHAGQTPLHLAARNGHRAVAAMLLDRGININAGNRHGQTALHLAAKNGHVSVVRLLVDRGVKISIRSRAGLTALHQAAENGWEGVVRLLLEFGADVNAKSETN
ncbi:MAG: hypothetical protein M1818_000505 [Claussenomyces sp. TS43310]|nr:MAG: hypothetical protein M1818_000505 [Claussenomyces sp. TS43310]